MKDPLDQEKFLKVIKELSALQEATAREIIAKYAISLEEEYFVYASMVEEGIVGLIKNKHPKLPQTTLPQVQDRVMEFLVPIIMKTIHGIVVIEQVEQEKQIL